MEKRDRKTAFAYLKRLVIHPIIDIKLSHGLTGPASIEIDMTPYIGQINPAEKINVDLFRTLEVFPSAV